MSSSTLLIKHIHHKQTVPTNVICFTSRPFQSPGSSTNMKHSNLVPLLILSISALPACDPAETNDAAAPESSDLSDDQARGESLQSEPIAMEDSSLWAPRSCAGACGGPSPDRYCWCDSSCSRHGDCCYDYRRECVDNDSDNDDNDSDNDSSDNTPGSFSITGYSMSGDGCDGYTPSGQPKHKTMITNSLPGGTDDYIQSTFDAFDVKVPDGRSSQRCRMTVYAKWTPGKRILISSFEQSGYADLSSSSRGRARLETRIRAGYASSANKSFSFSSPFSDSYDKGWGASSLDVYSGCSGHGSFTFDLNVRVNGGYSQEASASVDTVSALFRLAKSYEVPGC